jgi:exonuclease V gamma subunit
MTSPNTNIDELEHILEELMLDVLQEASRVAGKEIIITTFPEEKYIPQLEALITAAKKESYEQGYKAAKYNNGKDW